MGGILLVAGTAIGAGMLALPILTGQAGFTASTLLFIAVWLGALFTSLLVLEVNLWFKNEVNLISMARFTLGRKGEIVTWVLFLLLLYSLTAAYLAGSGTTISCALVSYFHYFIPPYLEPLPLLLLFAFFVYFGTRPADFLNRVCMVGLVICYFGLVGTALPSSDYALLSEGKPSYLFAAIPVVVTSFSFHVIIPVLTTYLKQDVKALKKAIWIGSLIPLFVYILWEFVILTVVPLKGELGIIEACTQGSMITESLSDILQNPWVTTFASLFAFFAILTSFLGVSLSLASFLSDGFKIRKSKRGKVFVTALTFVPPLIFVTLSPRGFIMALQYAGVFVAILSGILPALMVWRGRKLQREQVLYQVKGGHFALLSVIVVSIIIIASEVVYA